MGKASRGVAANYLLLAAGEFVAKLLTFAAFSYLARTLGPERYGNLEFTLAVMVFFTLPVDLGLGAYGAREIARNANNASRLLREVTDLRLMLAVCSFAAMLLVISLIHKSLELKLLLTAYAASLLLYPVLLQWFFQGHELMHWVALASITRQGVFASLLFIFLRPETPLPFIGLFELASLAAVVGLCFLLVRRMDFGLPVPTLNLRPLLAHLRQSSPIGLTELAWAFIWYFATVLMGLSFADRSVGWFGASHRALMAMHTFVWLYFFNLLPAISRCASLPHSHLLDLIGRSLSFACWTTFFGAFVMTALAADILAFIYGPLFANAGSSFSVLVWMLPLSMLSGHYGYTLIAYNLQRFLLYSTAVAALVAVSAGVVLVPLFGGMGAAWALLAANLVSFALQYYFVRRSIVEIRFLPQLAGPAAALCLAAVVFFALARFQLALGVAAAVACYAGMLAFSQGRKILDFMRGFTFRRVEVERSCAR